MDRVFTPKYIASADTYVLTPGAAVLHSIVIGETAAGTITVKDGANTIAVLKASIAEGTYLFDCATKGALSVITAGASKITVNFQTAA